MPRPRPIIDKGTLKIFKKPPNDKVPYDQYLIYIPEAPEKFRTLKVTLEELYELTETLDDLCDSIEDGEL